MTKKSDTKATANAGGVGKPASLVTDIDAGAEPTPIQHAGPLTVVRVTASRVPEGHDAVALPEGAAPGDAVEVYFRGYPGRVYPPEGECFDVNGHLPSVPCCSGHFRKIDDASWRFILGS
jgi:hypothetical protein